MARRALTLVALCLVGVALSAPIVDDDCPNKCSGHGVCTTGTCACNVGYGNPTPANGEGAIEDCSMTILPHGYIINGTVSCKDGFTGATCDYPPKPSSKMPGLKKAAIVHDCPGNCRGNGVCDAGVCLCFMGYKGEDCGSSFCGAAALCSGKGKCEDEKCKCEVGFVGDDCSDTISCPVGKTMSGAVKECSDQGTCNTTTYRCNCNLGYRGTNCSLSECVNDCNSHGDCIKDKGCQCYSGYTGIDCSVGGCPNDCSYQGTCVWMRSGATHKTKCKCECESEDHCFGGEDCSRAACPGGCNTHGKCTVEGCKCDVGWMGVSCEQAYCLNQCSGNGFCDVKTKSCKCDDTWSGDDCARSEIARCTDDCNGHGTCQFDENQTAICICEVDYWGKDCAQLKCVNNCSNNGICLNGTCLCEAGFPQPDCYGPPAKKTYGCLRNCSAPNGYCDEKKDMCVCQAGYAAPDCSHMGCPNNCFDHGKCVMGECQCTDGYEGVDCRERECPDACTGRGTCAFGRCICEKQFTGPACAGCISGYSGATCMSRACDKPCANNGTCANGRCACAAGFSGKYCHKRDAIAHMARGAPCGADCAMPNGLCMSGICHCRPGFLGKNCLEQASKSSCHGVGYWNQKNMTCACKPGYAGAECGMSVMMDCPTATPGAECSKHGKCIKTLGVCDCNTNWGGEDCSTDKSACPKGNGEVCSGHGLCENGACLCLDGFTGGACKQNYTAPKHSCEINNGGCSLNADCLTTDPNAATCVCMPGYLGDGKVCYGDVTDPCTIGDDNGGCDVQAKCKRVGRPPYRTNCTCNKGFAGDGKLCIGARCPGSSAKFPGGCNGHGECNATAGTCTCDSAWGGKDCAEDMPGLCALACNQQCVDFCVSDQRTTTEFASCYTACGTKCKDDQCNEKALKSKFANSTHVDYDQVSLSLGMDFMWVIQNRKAFEGNFSSDMAKSLDVGAKNVVIDSYHSGSTVIVFHMTKTSEKVDALLDTDTPSPALNFVSLSKATGLALEAKDIEKMPSSKQARLTFMKSMHADLKMFAVAGEEVPFNPVRAKLGTAAIAETIFQKWKSVDILLVKISEVTAESLATPDKDAAASYTKSIRKSLKEIGVKADGKVLGEANVEVVLKIMKTLANMAKKDVKDEAYKTLPSEDMQVVVDRVNKMLPAVSQTASTEAESKADSHYPANDGDRYPSQMSQKLPMTQAAPGH